MSDRKLSLKEKAQKKYKEFKTFMSVKLWLIDTEKESALTRIIHHQLRVAYIVYKSVAKSKIQHKASSLTYIMLLALVPFLAVVLSILKGFGGLAGLQHKVEPLIFQNLVPGSQEAMMEKITGFIENINAGAIGVVGGVGLFFTVLSLMTSIEQSFNDFWGIEKPRPLSQRFPVYITLLILGPIFFGLSVSMTAMFRSHAFLNYLEKIIPYADDAITFAFKFALVVTTWISFAVIYNILPNKRVSIVSSLYGGVIGGSVWELAKVGYTVYQAKSTNYNAIYGSLAAVPFFLLWIYISWMIILIGALLVYAHENVKTYQPEEAVGKTTYRRKKIIALWLMLHICRRFNEGQKPFSMQHIANRPEIPRSAAREALKALTDCGLAMEVSGEKFIGGYAPAKPLDKITTYDILNCISEEEGQPELPKEEPEAILAETLENELERYIKHSRLNLTVEELLERLQPTSDEKAGAENAGE